MGRTCSRHESNKSVKKYISRTKKGNRPKERKRKRERGVLLNDAVNCRDRNVVTR